MHIKMSKPKLVNVFDNKGAAQIRTNVRFLGPRANAELVPKFHVALHASHAALQMVTLKFRPNVALLMSA
jgi:hypothetical protein